MWSTTNPPFRNTNYRGKLYTVKGGDDEAKKASKKARNDYADALDHKYKVIIAGAGDQDVVHIPGPINLHA
jgi:diacylglycerol kinase family enzyme